ncbi:hypothetical protein K501DRAFT_337717 [Backusella circina FSU 941]|nr:hypothetical protein K501DRAFT_337717 [Backusella circina FSU 941]
MLRVYSILYIERLWNEKQQHEDTLPSIESVLDNKNDTREVIDQESTQQQQLLPVEEEAIEEVEEEVRENEAEGSNTNNNDFTVEEIVIETDLNDLQEQEEKPLPPSVQEQAVESLKIDTHKQKEGDSRESLSSESSIPSPLPKTPTSNYSLNSPTNSHRKTTSLIRRETTKLNDKRRSLTNKLKKALNNNDGGKKASI